MSEISIDKLQGIKYEEILFECNFSYWLWNLIQVIIFTILASIVIYQRR